MYFTAIISWDQTILTKHMLIIWREFPFQKKGSRYEVKKNNLKIALQY